MHIYEARKQNLWCIEMPINCNNLDISHLIKLTKKKSMGAFAALQLPLFQSLSSNTEPTD